MHLKLKISMLTCHVSSREKKMIRLHLSIVPPTTGAHSSEGYYCMLENKYWLILSQLKKFPRKIKTFNYTQTLQKLWGPLSGTKRFNVWYFPVWCKLNWRKPKSSITVLSNITLAQRKYCFHTIYLLGTIVSDKQYRYLDRKNMIRDNLTLSWIISHFYLH